MTDEAKPLEMSLSIDRKFSDGNYGSYSMMATVSHVTLDTTQEEIDALLNNTGKMVYSAEIAFLRTKLKDMEVKIP